MLCKLAFPLESLWTLVTAKMRDPTMNKLMLFQLATEHEPLTTIPVYVLIFLLMGVFMVGKSTWGVASFPTYIADAFVVILLVMVVDRLST